MNQSLAQRDCHRSLPCAAAQNGQFCQFLHPDPTWRPHGPRVLENLAERICIGPLGSFSSKATYFLASPLRLYGLAEGPILDFSEQKSGLAATAHFQRPTPKG